MLFVAGRAGGEGEVHQRRVPGLESERLSVGKREAIHDVDTSSRLARRLDGRTRERLWSASWRRQASQARRFGIT